MVGGAHAPAAFVVVGANHRSSSAALRDRIFVEEAACREVLARLSAEGVVQALVLSTCDRVEVQGMAEDAEAMRAAVARVLGERSGYGAAELGRELYLHTEGAALRHIFAVASSLLSAVVGEPQVLGQLKAAHRIAREAGMIGSELEAALQAAYAAAKRVRSETAIAAGPVSIVATAVELAREVHGELEPLRGLLIGTGDMGLLMAEALIKAGLGHVTVAAPQAARAEAVARQLGGHYAEFGTLGAALGEADVVIASAGTGRYLLSGEMMEQALRRRRRRPVYLIDLGVPSDIEPAVNRVDDAYLYDLTDLERGALAGQAERLKAAEAAWRIIEEELERFARARAERGAVPALVSLRRHVERLRADVLAELGESDAAEATRRLVNRLLHEPSEALRKLAAAEDRGSTGESAERANAERLIRRLFGLAARDDAADSEEDKG